jgi:hypothetical protein
MAGATTSTTALAVVLAVTGSIVAGLGGCARANPYALPIYDAAHGSSQTPTAAPSRPSIRQLVQPPVASRSAAPPTAVSYRPSDAWGEGAWVERGKIVANSPEQLAAVDAVAKYMSVRVQLSNTWQVDERALAAVASGQARTSAQERAVRQRELDQRSIGRFIINVSSVHVSGSRATVTGCHFDATSEVDQNGNVLIAPPGGVLITMTLQRTAGTWRVVDWPDRPAPVCDWRK